jgi:aspartate/methionine/tyrosine aminotransferase
MYPSYTQLLDMPEAITGTQVSLWKISLDSTHQRKNENSTTGAGAANLLDITALKALIKPNTKMIVLNNPNNPTGTMLSPNLQQEILSLAHSQGIFVVVDEIFRPLYHGPPSTPLPPSFAEIDTFDNAIITGSLSKAWGLAGVRVGWIATRSEAFMSAALNTRLYTINAISTLDEAVAIEALSPRCRPQILRKHLDIARVNLEILEQFVERVASVSMVRPFAGATAFLRIVLDGGPVDDVEFCIRLKEETGVLLAPGSKCFGVDGSGEELRGFVRVHLTGSSDVLRGALSAVGGYLEKIGAKG